MNMTNNCILITGGGSGIGRGLAESFHARGNQVIISGRNREKLEEVISANPGMECMMFDITDAQSINNLARQVTEKYPTLDVLINNAGIMKIENLVNSNISASTAEEIILTNLLGPIRLLSALLPSLLKQPKAVIMNVSSGLAFVPMAITPTYCASKAAIHSYSQSLRYQLKNSSIQVLELIPPYVQTELMGERQASDPMAMPLEDFISETMNILESTDDIMEICVERVLQMRNAEKNGEFNSFFKHFNERVSELHDKVVVGD